ncbi:MAG: PadR family transcriptional regulator [Flammeovirgaceae bacterium]|nr:PadR family transcriptional regulator [Flammeovirgaceae bacterium]MBE62896.1 PadR family transcriptional regulator [Flammeovirgaceae bacterium]MBR11336.1 PadR family transcriptional regulator [Rickettsiales bacterium]
MGEEKVQLGEFEELVLLITAILHENAYGVKVLDEIESQTGRKANISGVHTALDRLEKKGYLRSYLGGATAERGGRRKRYFKVTDLGIQVLEINHKVRNSLFNQIPAVLLHHNE